MLVQANNESHLCRQREYLPWFWQAFHTAGRPLHTACTYSTYHPGRTLPPWSPHPLHTPGKQALRSRGTTAPCPPPCKPQEMCQECGGPCQGGPLAGKRRGPAPQLARVGVRIPQSDHFCNPPHPDRDESHMAVCTGWHLSSRQPTHQPLLLLLARDSTAPRAPFLPSCRHCEHLSSPIPLFLGTT